MPITQSRILALISAVEDYATALRLAEAECKRACYEMEQGKDPKELLNRLARDITTNMLLQRPADSAATLAVERHHFRPATVRKNDNERRRAAEKRGGPVRQQTQHRPMSELDEANAQARIARRELFEIPDESGPLDLSPTEPNIAPLDPVLQQQMAEYLAKEKKDE